MRKRRLIYTYLKPYLLHKNSKYYGKIKCKIKYIKINKQIIKSEGITFPNYKLQGKFC